MTGILVRNPNERMNFEQMMEHPWMKIELSDEPLPLDKVSLEKNQS